MKIGIDGRLWDETGVGRYTRNLVLNLQKIDKKNEYVLFVLDKDRQEILKSIRQAQDQNDKFKIIEADIRWHTINEQLKLSQIINKENLDIVHFPYPSIPIFYNRPFVITIHDLIPYHYPTGKASTLPLPIYSLKLLGYRFVINKAAQKAKKIITVSNATKKDIVDHLNVDSNKIVVIYEGVDDKISNFKSQISNKPQNTKYFLYIGNVYPHKNLDRLIQALNILISNYPNIFLIMVGKEDYFYERLKGKVKSMDLEKYVKFLGEVNDEELVNLYKNAIALVMPSLMEGFGLPALEAMANKCLVLASDIPSLKEVCADAAVYFDPYDPKDIAEKMEEVCFNDSNHFSEKIKMGLERTKKFSWQKMAQETLQVYEDSVGLR